MRMQEKCRKFWTDGNWKEKNGKSLKKLKNMRNE